MKHYLFTQRPFIIVVFLCFAQISFGQDVFYSTFTHLFKVNLNSCQLNSIGTFTNSMVSLNNVYDIAFHPNGNLYATNGSDLFIIDTLNANPSLVGYHISPFGGSFINALVTANNGTMYGADPGGVFYSINVNTGYATILGTLPVGSAGDLAFFNGKLYMAAMGGDIYEVDINNPAQSISLGSTNASEDFYGIITVATSCQNAALYGGQNSLFQVDLGTLNTTMACPILAGTMTGMSMPTDFIISDCNIYIDLDDDNSSGAINGDFQDSTCGSSSPISDTDVIINSDADIDSITIWIDNGILNSGNELLNCSNAPNINVLQNNSNVIKLLPQNNANISDFENALTNTTYINQASNPQNGLRVIKVRAYVNNDTSDIVQAELLMDFVYDNDTTFINSTTCDPTMAGSQLQVLMNQNGCDSIVISNNVLLATDTTFINSTTCDTSLAGIQIQNLTNQYGCDSVTITNNTLLPRDTTYLNGTTCDPVSSGIFTTIYSNQYGCDSLIISTIQLLPSDTIANISYTCDTSQVYLNIQTFTNQYGCDSVIINQVVYIPVDSTYLIEHVCDSSLIGNAQTVLTNSYGCDSIVFLEFRIGLREISYNVDIDHVDCYGENTGSVTVNLANQENYQIIWENGDSLFSIDSVEAGWQIFSIINEFGCPEEDSIFINSPSPLILNTIQEDIICFGGRDGIMRLSASGGTPPYLYRRDENFTFSNARIYSGLNTGSYLAQVQDDNGCLQSELIVFQNPLPMEVSLGEDLVINYNTDTVINVMITNGNPPFQYIWSPDIEGVACFDCETLQIESLQSSQYFTVEVRDSQNCTAQDIIWLSVDKNIVVEVPSGFTPDGDGVNDFLFVQANEWITSIINFSVYDRWGERVFSTNDILQNLENLGWNGTFNGQPMQNGVFGWMVEVELNDGTRQTFYGNSTLIR